MQNLRFKFAALIFMAILLCQSCCLVYGVGLQRAFAAAAPDTYIMQNIIYINATGLGKTTPEIKRIVISESLKSSEIPLKGIGVEDFDVNTSTDVDLFQSLYEYQDESATSVNLLDMDVNCTGAEYAICNSFNNELVPINTSDWYALGFNQPDLTFPVLKRTLFFKSPLVYAQEYCADNGYVFRNIINSTYYQEYNMNTLNTFKSSLVKTDIALIGYNESEVMATELKQIGGKLAVVPLKQGWEILAVGIVLIFFAVFFVKPLIEQWLNDQAALKGLKEVNEANYQALALGVNTTKSLADHMLADKNAQRQLVINFYANGTISWEQLQYLLQQIDYSYNPLINNCTFNIAQMVAAYFNSTVNAYGEYTQALANVTSWTDWIWDVIYLVAALMVAYIVYSIVSKRKAASQSGPAVYVMHS